VKKINTLDGLKVVAIDGVELFESTKKCFEKCLSRMHKNGVTHCFLHSPTGVETVLLFIIIGFNLMRLYFFRCVREFRKKRMLQIDIIEDIRNERFIIEDSWDNPLFMKT
jgi:hypothetical protein